MKKQPIIEGFVLMNVSTKKFLSRIPVQNIADRREYYTNKLQEARFFHTWRSASIAKQTGEIAVPLARFFHSGGK